MSFARTSVLACALLIASAVGARSLAASETFFTIIVSGGQEILVMFTEYAPGEMFQHSVSSYSTVTRIPLSPAIAVVEEAPAAVAGGMAAVLALAAIATYEAYEYNRYTDQMVNQVGSEPAHALTGYEDPSNYGEQFMRMYFPSYAN
jgi:hypothetical protein